MKKWLIIVLAVFLVGVAAVGPFYGSIINQQQTQTTPNSNAFSIGSASAASADDTVRIYLKIDNIPGDSTNREHKDQIEIEDFNWTESIPLTRNTRSTTTTEWGAFSFTAISSSASPKLFLNCASQRNIRCAELYVTRTTNDGSMDFIVWKFEEVVVGSYSTSFRGSDGAVVDDFGLYFGKAEVTYVPMNADGTYGSPVKASFNYQTNKDA